MKRLIRRTAIVLVLFSIGLSGIMAQSDSDAAYLRFVHVIPGVTAFDVYVDGQLTVSSLEYGEASGYVNVPPGGHDVAVRTSGLTTVLWQQQIDAQLGEPKTLIASTIDPLLFDVYTDDFKTVSMGTTRLRIVHAISGGGGVDIMYGGDPIANNVAYRETVGAFDLPADTYAFSVLATGGDSPILSETPFSLVSNTSQMLLLYGTPALPEALVLSAPLAGETDNGALRLAHSVPGGPSVDFFANGTKVAPALDFGMTTDHLRFASGTLEIEIRATEDGTVVGSATVDLSTGNAATVIAMGTPEAVTIGVFDDDVSAVSSDSAVVAVVNAIGEGSTVSVVMADGTVLADGLTDSAPATVTLVDPTTQRLSFTPSLNGQSATFDLDPQDFYGGAYYNIIAVGGTMFSPPTLVIASTDIASSVGSAPGAGDMVVEAPTEAPPVVVAQPTEAPPIETDAPSTEASVLTEVPPAPPPVVVSEEPKPTARVVLDPGANLQLRQYPSSEAFSLGLAPSGSVLIVNGREGAPVDIDGNEIPIGENTDGSSIFFVDPAVELDPEDPRADIVPEETWLNITFATPDGGQITAWVNALYLDVREPDGDRQRLVLLPMIPGNRYGGAEDTEMTPPPPTENRITVEVINLDVGANLNVRRTPDIQGEILARLPNGTIAEFLGMGGSGEWGFVLFAPPEGGSITGWVSVQFVDYALNGEGITLERLQDRDLVKPVDEETTIGEVSADAPEAAAPVQNPTLNAYVADVRLNQGANLNLRRNPDAQAEVLARIPSGSQLIVDGRTGDGLWLVTSFESQQGWVASAYVVVTFNGNFVEIDEIPVIAGTEATDTESNG